MMIMGISGHSLFGFLLSGLALALLLLVQAQDQSGFISLDCGLPEGTSYTEMTTKINYVSDASFINSGVSQSVASAYGDDTYPRQLRRLRSFPQGIRNCYSISIVKGTEYLIRASFLYGNYDGLDSLPMFDLYIGNSLWETLNFTGNGMDAFIDLIHVTSSNVVHICLINTGNGVPFISALEFRPSLNITYQTMSASLSLHTRMDMGSTDGRNYRNLSTSGLTGKISSYLSNLTMLQTLDLSNNELTGELPEFLVNLPNLRILYLTGNRFTGLIPKALLQRAEAGLLTLSVGENPDLCTSLKCDSKRKNDKRKYLALIILFSIIAVLLPILVVTLVIYKRRKQRENLKRSIQERLLKSKNQQVRYSEILVITDNLKTTIGEGGFGKVYLGVHSDRTQVAVKLLSTTSQQGHNEFRAEAQILTVVHHRNLVSLVGYCDEAENKALIYEFMGNGNLRNHLSDSSTKVLSWMERLQIAIDAAQGLEYLHNGCMPPIIHRDMKSSNILLNDKMQAKISDFGLSRVFANENDTHFSTCPAGTFGYVDPTCDFGV